MQAILTYYIPATNTRGCRLKAICDRGSITIPYPDGAGDEAHIKAADALVAKFVLEDEKEYGSTKETNPWSRPRVCGGLHNGTTAHVFLA